MLGTAGTERNLAELSSSATAAHQGDRAQDCSNAGGQAVSCVLGGSLPGPRFAQFCGRLPHSADGSCWIWFAARPLRLGASLARGLLGSITLSSPGRRAVDRRIASESHGSPASRPRCRIRNDRRDPAGERIGEGWVWGLGAAALACLAFRAGAYVTGRIRRPASQAAAQ